MASLDRYVFGAGFAIGALATVCLFFFGLGAAGCLPYQIKEDRESADTRWENSAVQHHAAEWYEDEDGERQFRWLEPAQPAEEPRVR